MEFLCINTSHPKGFNDIANFSINFLPRFSSGSFAPWPSQRYTACPPGATKKNASPLLRFWQAIYVYSIALAASPNGAYILNKPP